MPDSFEFMRAVLGLIGLGCAYMAGRSFAAYRKGWQKLSKLQGWILRAVVCLAGIAFRHEIDRVAIAVWAVAAGGFVMGYWQMAHQKPPEDLSRDIFPHEP